MSAKLVVFAGGPGVGKTALLNAMSRRGFPVIKEAATAVMERTGIMTPWLLPDAERDCFRSKVVTFYIEHESLCAPASTVFMDRSLVDTTLYAEIERREIPKDTNLLMGDLRSRYSHIFGIEPLTNIEYPEQVRKLHVMTIMAYERYGYQVIHVPPLPLNERCSFILNMLDRQSSQKSNA